MADVRILLEEERFTEGGEIPEGKVIVSCEVSNDKFIIDKEDAEKHTSFLSVPVAAYIMEEMEKEKATETSGTTEAKETVDAALGK